ncbi:hypothetical protein hmeg3_20200 [Herbaspirillum sp. meg3]|jgi:hypothetical protein|uniref:hypothetical protein n=1 Tax=Herbaspirillum sp. meg3 TaxID=2025949 RepID=UPI000B988786|nr:hypothetical protein [Herbaspirillum sp. meg3]ASU40386.1 hypothetical protein hmeg3_20200 [Herbaspirillum sp. meg3]
MKRLFALLLICLLPMQVFAGMLTYKTGIDSAALEFQVQQQQMLEMQRLLTEVAGAGQTAADDQQILAGQSDQIDQTSQADRDDDTSYADSEDFSNHAGVGDETVLNPTLAFIVDSATLAPALRSDDARQPPFLPPAGRPPRV